MHYRTKFFCHKSDRYFSRCGINIRIWITNDVLTATDQKPQKSYKWWYCLPRHRLNANMKQSNINFLSFSSDFKLPMFILHLNYSCLIYFCSFFVNFKRIVILHRVLRKIKGIVTSNVIQVYNFVLYFHCACAEMHTMRWDYMWASVQNYEAATKLGDSCVT